MPAPTGATPPIAALLAEAGWTATSAGWLPTRPAINAVCELTPPEPGSDAARTSPLPPPAPEPPASGWLENDGKGVVPALSAPLPPAPPPPPISDDNCCNGCVTCCIICWGSCISICG